jgi:membrane protease YdiL (CAAX protease family)
MTESTPKIHEEMESKPLKFFPALGLFAIPTGIMIAMYYGLFPRWVGRFGAVNGYFFSFIVALLTIFFVAISLFYHESDETHPATWERMKTRFNLKKLTWHDWKWIAITLIPMFPLSIGMGMLNEWLLDVLNISIPWSGIYEQQANNDLLSPNAFQVTMMIVVLLVNIPAEELLFRGYLYPRQEVVHGKWTWVIHGLMWWIFHCYKWFSLPTIFFNSLLIPLLSHKTKNTTATMVSHFIGNAASIAVGYILLLI